jgi:hypothetical protein
MMISDLGFRISDLTPTHPEPQFPVGAGGKSEIPNPKSEIKRH